MSGGARSACSVALAAHFAGDIACSGGFPEDKVPPEAVFAFFGTAGREDFNYQEMRRIDATLAARNTPHRLAIFDGGHEWLPAPLTTEALEWLDLQALRSGLRSRDDALVARRLQNRIQSAGAMKDDGEAYLAWLAIAADFNGLADTAGPAAKAAALKDTKPVRQYLKAEKKAQRQEERWLERFQAAVEQARHPAPRLSRREVVETLRRQSGADEDPRFGNPNPDRLRDPDKEFRPDGWLRPEIDSPAAPANDADRFAALRDVAAIARRDAESSLPARRALNGSFAVFFEQGREQLDAQNSDGAIENLEVAVILRPEVPGIHFELARAYALRGDRDRARELLATALAKGFQDDTRIHELQASLTR
jgi:tetratricopeptide (TPR) repeat protein